MSSKKLGHEGLSTAELAESLRDAVGGLVRAVREKTETPSDAQSDALSYLQRHGPTSVAMLAGSRNVTHQTMRVVVARLEAAGLVERRPDPTDRRGQLVELTDLGRDLAAEGQRARATWLKDAIEASLSQKEQAVLEEAVALLRRIGTFS